MSELFDWLESNEPEAYKYGAMAVPYLCKDVIELADWFRGFAEARRED